MNEFFSSLKLSELHPAVVTFIIVLGLLAIIFFVLLSMVTLQLTKLRISYNKIMRSFNDLDEQAKLIVKTDLELNKAQEELDKRLQGLNTLQKTSRQISMALDEKDIFQKLNEALFTSLGFAFGLILNLDDQKVLRCKTSAGFSNEKIVHILSQLEKDERFKSALKDAHTFSSVNCSKQTKERIIQIFDVEHFILTPILSQAGMVGLIFVGNRYSAPSVTTGDEELISILADQIGQSLENAKLFEQVFKSSQVLESKVKERTKQLASLLEKVNSISKKKSEFISAVSHELRTPLTSIKGYASILMAGKIGEIPTAVKERLSKINLHSDNLVKLINDLLDIARIESGRQEMKFHKQKIKQLLDNIQDLLTPQLTAKALKLKIIIPDNAPEIYVDPSQVERIFINLIGNAIKFTPAQGTITIEARPSVDKDVVNFSVADTGIGIKEEDLQKLFEEFYRVDNEINQNVKGTGLGLTLAKNIVEAHRGRMNVTSKVGVGTTFSFTLPISEKIFATKPEEVDSDNLMV